MGLFLSSPLLFQLFGGSPHPDSLPQCSYKSPLTTLSPTLPRKEKEQQSRKRRWERHTFHFPQKEEWGKKGNSPSLPLSLLFADVYLTCIVFFPAKRERKEIQSQRFYLTKAPSLFIVCLYRNVLQGQASFLAVSRTRKKSKKSSPFYPLPARIWEGGEEKRKCKVGKLSSPPFVRSIVV